MIETGRSGAHRFAPANSRPNDVPNPIILARAGYPFQAEIRPVGQAFQPDVRLWLSGWIANPTTDCND